MKFAEKIFERATVKGIADYLLYGMVPDRDGRSYERRLDDADLAYEKVAKQYDEDGASVLLSAANELANENASVYMELGLQAGILLIADLFQNIYWERNQAVNSTVLNNHEAQQEQNTDADSNVNSDVDSDIKSGKESDTNMEPEIGRSVLQQIIRNRLDTALEDTLRKDRKYQSSKQKAEGKAGRLAKDMFTPEQWKLIEDALDDSNASGSEYGRVAYQQGLSNLI